MTKQKLLDAIQSFYGNTQVPRSETREGLEHAKEEIEQLLETLGEGDE